MTHSTISQILIIVALLRLRVAPALALGSYWIHHHHRRSGPATAISVKPDADDIFTADDYDFFTGSPSTPGFRSGEFDQLSSWALSTRSNRPIVSEYEPDGLWLWTQWEGTIRQMAWKSIAVSLIWSTCVNFYAYHHYITRVNVDAGPLTWWAEEIRLSNDSLYVFLASVGELWSFLFSLAVFTLAFFLNTSYEHWKAVYFAARAMQGRINDICMLVTSSAGRDYDQGTVDGTTGFHRNSRQLVVDIKRQLRMSHAFFWAATPTASDGLDDNSTAVDPTQIGPRLLTPQGLQTLVDCGQLTANENSALIATGLSPSQYAYCLLEWAMIRSMEGIQRKELIGSAGLEENILRQFTQLRAEYFNIGDYASGRMPMAYLIAIQIIVDLLVYISPLALYTRMGAFTIPSTGLICLTFTGLLELSKSFLDTFGTEGYTAHNIRVDVLVSEVNFGASQRWYNAADLLPSEMHEGGDNDI